MKENLVLILSAIPALLGSYIIFFNWYAFIKSLKPETNISGIPLVGPLFLVFGLHFLFPGALWIYLVFLFDVFTIMVLIAPIMLALQNFKKHK